MTADDPIARYWRALADNNWSKAITHDNDPCDDATGWFRIEWVPVMDDRVRLVHMTMDFYCDEWHDAMPPEPIWERQRCIPIEPKTWSLDRHKPIVTAETFECQLCGRIWPTGHSCENCHPERNQR